MDTSIARLVEEDRYRRTFVDIEERGRSARSSLVIEVQLGRKGAVSLSAIMSVAAIAFAIFSPWARVLLITMIAVAALLSGVLLIWLRLWFGRALAEEASTSERLIDAEISRHLKALEEIGHA